MSQVISFRPDEEEAKLIEKTRRRLGFASRTAAVRHLLHAAAQKERPLSEDPVFQFRLPPQFRRKKSVTSSEIDDVLYGGG